MSSGKSRPLSYSGPRPLRLVDGNVQPLSPPVSSYSSSTYSGLSTPPPTAKPRRQSSISYFPSDRTPSWDLRSPTVGASSLKRSQSLGQKTVDRRSIGSTESQSPRGERPPLTLTEKHADLLQFIAQKESKCLELRSQLAIHEAELAQLKRKWERIVNRGMDRSSSSALAPINIIRSPSSSAPVLEGIKEGVGRLLTTGLGDLASPPSESAPLPVQTMSGFATVSRAAMAPALKKAPRHANTQSTSSVSTTATNSTRSASMRLSQSSASSLAFEDSPREADEKDVPEDHGRGGVEISPATALRAAKLHRRKSRDGTGSTPLPNAPTTPSVASPSPSSRAAKRSSINLASGLPPPASIPGLGTLAVQPMSSWMETVGKRWGEIQKGETFTKSQKRASVLLSDVSQSFFSALASPGPSSSGAGVSVSSNPFTATLSPLSTSPSPSSPVVAPGSSTASLLDDDDEAQGLGGVLTPDSRGPPNSPSPSLQAKDQSDDEWNW